MQINHRIFFLFLFVQISVLTMCCRIIFLPCPSTNNNNSVYNIMQCKEHDSKVCHEYKPFCTSSTANKMTYYNRNKQHSHKKPVYEIQCTHFCIWTPLEKKILSSVSSFGYRFQQLGSLSFRIIPISSTYLAPVEKIRIIMSQRVAQGFIIPTAMTTASSHDFHVR